jgi:hypothetical protein
MLLEVRVTFNWRGANRNYYCVYEPWGGGVVCGYIDMGGRVLFGRVGGA